MSGHAQATEAKRCVAGGQRALSEIESLFTPGYHGMSLAQQNRYFRDAGPQLIDTVEQKAGEVTDIFFSTAVFGVCSPKGNNV